jgi:ATP-binding cassette subfamily B protein
LKESGVWQDRQTPEVQLAQRQADYSYRLAVDAPAAKEVRLFGLGPWIVQRFGDQREQLYRMQYDATRLRERSTLISLAVVLGANVAVFWVLADRLADGRMDLGGAIIAVTAALGVSGIAFGGLTWAMDGAAAPAAAIERLAAVMPAAGALGTDANAQVPRSTERGPEICFRDVTFGYADGPPVLEHFDLTVPAGRSIAIVGQNGAGKTTLAKLICRLYDPNGGAIDIDGQRLVDLDVVSWRRQLTAVFQDFVRFELTLRENVTTDLSGTGADPTVDREVRAALTDAGAAHLADLDTPLAKAYPGGTDLSGGQWQRIALARALYSVRMGARVVLLDEPTAQLDVKGEAEIFDRVLRATADVECTTILVSHRFSTVRRADLICVMEHGRVIELGTHDELMALGGRYRTMFDLQAARFADTGDPAADDDAEVSLDTLD